MGRLWVPLLTICLGLYACSDEKKDIDDDESSGSSSHTGHGFTSLDGMASAGINALKRKDISLSKRLLPSDEEWKALLIACDGSSDGVEERSTRMRTEAEQEMESCLEKGLWSRAREVGRTAMEERSSGCDAVTGYEDFSVLYQVDGDYVEVEYEGPMKFKGRIYTQEMNCQYRKAISHRFERRVPERRHDAYDYERRRRGGFDKNRSIFSLSDKKAEKSGRRYKTATKTGPRRYREKSSTVRYRSK